MMKYIIVLLGCFLWSCRSIPIVPATPSHSNRSSTQVSIPMTLKKEVRTTNAPAAIGPYSQGIIANGFFFAAGQIALHPATGELITSDIQSETQQVMSNIHGLLKAAGCDWKDVVKASVFVKDIRQFAAINAVYETYFKGITPPARELVEVRELPRQVNIEISVIAAIPAEH